MRIYKFFYGITHGPQHQIFQSMLFIQSAPADVSHLWLKQLHHYVFLSVFPNALSPQTRCQTAAAQQKKLILQLCPHYDPLKNGLVSLYPESEGTEDMKSWFGLKPSWNTWQTPRGKIPVLSVISCGGKKQTELNQNAHRNQARLRKLIYKFGLQNCFTNLVLTYSIFQNSTIPKFTSREFQDFKNSANSFHPSISLERDGQWGGDVKAAREKP